jgi:RES domain-containing protein
MELHAGEPRRRRIRWRQSYRLIPSRFPPVDLFERVAAAEDLAAIHELESLTNDRLRDEAGEIQLVASGDRVSGPGAGYVMASFTHISPTGGRFNTPEFGAYYAGHDLATAMAESTHHRAAFMRATQQAPMELDMRVLEAELDGRLHDVRGMQEQLPPLYDRDDYSESQRFATRLRAEGSDGIVYHSVRRDGGECVAVFRPKRIRNCHAALHLTYVWDGGQIASVYEKRLLTE